MSWTRYLLHDFWTARALNELEEKLTSSRRNARRQVLAKAALSDRVRELEQDLEETVLLARALADVCMAKGLLDAKELGARIEHLDGLDGVVDGRIGKPGKPADEGD